VVSDLDSQMNMRIGLVLMQDESIGADRERISCNLPNRTQQRVRRGTGGHREHDVVSLPTSRLFGQGVPSQPPFMQQILERLLPIDPLPTLVLDRESASLRDIA
jgi:hypothetical protein